MFGAPKASSGGLFGQNASNTQNQSSGLFGQKPAGATTPSVGTSGGLFGNTTANQTNQGQQQIGQTSSLLGQQPSQQPAAQQGFGVGGGTSTGLFGNKPAAAPLNNTAASSFQKPATQQPFQQQPIQQQQQQGAPVITPFTRPSDLPEAFQKELENMDSYIRHQAQLSEDLTHAMSEHKTLVTSIPRDVQLLHFKLTSAKETLKFDDGQLAKLKQLIDTDYHDAELLVEVTNQPRKYDRLLPYFRRIASCDSHLDQLALAMRDVQQAITAEEFGNRITYDEQGVRALPRAMKEEYMYFMSLSDRIAELHRHIKEDGEGETLEEMQI